jgi:hypothetical protein
VKVKARCVPFLWEKGYSLYFKTMSFLTNKFLQNLIEISYIGDYLRLLIAIMPSKLFYNIKIKTTLAFSKTDPSTI